MPSEVTVRVILREKEGPLDSPLRIVLGYTALHIERRYEVTTTGISEVLAA